ncbi:hypothetical protein KAX35_07615, partial [candidate division WOR-3 bacterium]|nr:hypothetical protein [candidate division WOR-3 bacterium]
MLRINILMLFTVFSSSLFGRALSLEEAKVCNPEVERLIECASGDEKEWVDSLLQYMPTIDLVTLNADSFLL